MFYGNGRFFVAFLKIKDKTNKTFMVEIYRRKKNVKSLQNSILYSRMIIIV